MAVLLKGKGQAGGILSVVSVSHKQTERLLYSSLAYLDACVRIDGSVLLRRLCMCLHINCLSCFVIKFFFPPLIGC